MHITFQLTGLTEREHGCWGSGEGRLWRPQLLHGGDSPTCTGRGEEPPWRTGLDLCSRETRVGMGHGLEWECPRQRQGGPRCPVLGEGSWSLSEDGQGAQDVRRTPVLLWAALLTSPVTCESPCAESCLSSQAHAWVHSGAPGVWYLRSWVGVRGILHVTYLQIIDSSNSNLPTIPFPLPREAVGVHLCAYACVCVCTCS